MNDAPRFDELIPATVDVTARMAYLQLLRFQELSAGVSDAPDLASKQQLGKIAARALSSHEQLMALLPERTAEERKRFVGIARQLDPFARRIAGRDPQERLVTIHIAGGILSDFFLRVVQAMPERDRAGLESLIDVPGSEEQLMGLIRSASEREELLADRLAMWGRRIASDCLLACREMLGIPAGTSAEEAKPGSEAIVEQLGSELMANHSRRMNALGFAA